MATLTGLAAHGSRHNYTYCRQVAARVREALAKRDKVIQELRTSLDEARAVQADTEALLEKQRRELLGVSGSV